LLAERAARLPAGPSNPGCHAGVSFTALRDSAALPAGVSAWRFFAERFAQLASAAQALAVESGDGRAEGAASHLSALSKRAARGAATSVAVAAAPAAPVLAPAEARALPPLSTVVEGVERAEGEKLTLLFEAKRCIIPASA
jgi:hypothetical protein